MLENNLQIDRPQLRMRPLDFGVTIAPMSFNRVSSAVFFAPLEMCPPKFPKRLSVRLLRKSYAGHVLPGSVN
jgi:hypothetical protein